MGADQAYALQNADTKVPGENAGFPMPQELADPTLAEVGHLVPVIAPVLIAIFGRLVILRYPTKPIPMAVYVSSVSICTYLQGKPPMEYECAARDRLSTSCLHHHQHGATIRRKHDGCH